VAAALHQPLGHLRPWLPHEEPTAPPVSSRWRGGTTTFGPVGRVTITVVLMLFQLFWWRVVGPGGVELLFVSYLASTAASIWILTHVWKRDRVQ
jgi:hypothetical protein